MRYHCIVAAFTALFCVPPFSGSALADTEMDARGFIASIAPPGAKISFSSLEENAGTIKVRDIVAQAQNVDGGEAVESIGLLELHGLRPLERGLYHADRVIAENIRIDAVGDGRPGGGIKIARLNAAGIEGARFAELKTSGVSMNMAYDGGSYSLNVEQGDLHDIDAKPFNRAGGRPDSLLNALMNEHVYGALHLRGLTLRRDGSQILSIASLGSNADGGYAPFPASGDLSLIGGRLDLRAAAAPELIQTLGQDVLQFTLSSKHGYRAPASHQWDIRLEISPDGALQGRCAADRLSAFQPSLIGQALAAGGGGALRSCDLNFTGTEFVNRWLARDGAKEGLTADQARAKYLAAALYIPFDPQAGADPLAAELSKAIMVFLSQPSRLNLRLDPPGGLNPVAAAASLAMLMHGAPAQKQQAMQKLGLRLSAEPLN